jgi:hypothetical protein
MMHLFFDEKQDRQAETAETMAGNSIFRERYRCRPKNSRQADPAQEPLLIIIVGRLRPR